MAWWEFWKSTPQGEGPKQREPQWRGGKPPEKPPEQPPQPPRRDGGGSNFILCGVPVTLTAQSKNRAELTFGEGEHYAAVTAFLKRILPEHYGTPIIGEERNVISIDIRAAGHPKANMSGIRAIEGLLQFLSTAITPDDMESKWKYFDRSITRRHDRKAKPPTKAAGERAPITPPLLDTPMAAVEEYEIGGFTVSIGTDKNAIVLRGDGGVSSKAEMLLGIITDDLEKSYAFGRDTSKIRTARLTPDMQNPHQPPLTMDAVKFACEHFRTVLPNEEMLDKKLQRRMEELDRKRRERGQGDGGRGI